MQCDRREWQWAQPAHAIRRGGLLLQMEVPCFNRLCHPTFSENASIELVRVHPPPPVDLDSPSRLVMTDLADMTAADDRAPRALAQAATHDPAGRFRAVRRGPGCRMSWAS